MSNVGFNVGNKSGSSIKNKPVENQNFGKNKSKAHYNANGNRGDYQGNDEKIDFKASNKNTYSAERTSDNSRELNFKNGNRNNVYLDRTENETTNASFEVGEANYITNRTEGNSHNISARDSESLLVDSQNSNGDSFNITGSYYGANDIDVTGENFQGFNVTGGNEDDWITAQGNGDGFTVDAGRGDDEVNLIGEDGTLTGAEVDLGRGNDTARLRDVEGRIEGGNGEDQAIVRGENNDITFADDMEQVLLDQLEGVDGGLPEGYNLTQNEDGQYVLSNQNDDGEGNRFAFDGGDTSLAFGDADGMSLSDWFAANGSETADADLPETTIGDDTVDLRGKNLGEDAFNLDFGDDTAIVNGDTKGTIKGGADTDTLRSELNAADYDNIAFNEETGEYTFTKGDNDLVSSQFEAYNFADQNFDNLDDFNAYITENFPVDGDGGEGGDEPGVVSGDAQDNVWTRNADNLFNNTYNGLEGSDTLNLDGDNFGLYDFDSITKDDDGNYTFTQGDNSFTANSIENFGFTNGNYTQTQIDDYLANIAADNGTNEGGVVDGDGNLVASQDFSANGSSQFTFNPVDSAVNNINFGDGFDTLNLNGTVDELNNLFDIAQTADGFQLVGVGADNTDQTIEINGAERVNIGGQTINAANMTDLISLLQNLLGAA